MIFFFRLFLFARRKLTSVFFWVIAVFAIK